MTTSPDERRATTTDPVGVVGVGRMGGAIAMRLLAQGHQVVAADTSPDARARIASHGAAIVGSAAELAVRCARILLVCNTDEQLLDALSGPDGVLATAAPRTVVAMHATVRLDTVQVAAEATRARDVALLDAGVTGGADPALRGELAILVGGDAAVVASMRPVFEAYASRIVHAGELGAGMAAKHAVQTILMGKVAATYEGLLLAHAAGIDTIALADAVRHAEEQSCIHAFVLASVAHTLAHGADDTWRAVTTHQRPVAVKDLDAAVSLADQLGLAMPVTRAARDVMPQVWSA